MMVNVSQKNHPWNTQGFVQWSHQWVGQETDPQWAVHWNRQGNNQWMDQEIMKWMDQWNHLWQVKDPCKVKGNHPWIDQ
jgi:hypothetical protein